MWTETWIRARIFAEEGKKTAIDLELCAGAASRRSPKAAGIDHAGLVEIDEICCATLTSNRPKWNVINADLNDFDAASFAGVI